MLTLCGEKRTTVVGLNPCLPMLKNLSKIFYVVVTLQEAAAALASWHQLLEEQESAAAVAEEAVQDLIREGKEAVMAEMEAVARRHLHRRCSSRHRHGQLQMEQKETAAAVARDT
jgi:hypothetical protein